jgi:tRNA 2-thiocytidine biosynthesis protein TtcA
MTDWASRIRKEMSRAASDYGLIEAGDRILVAISGGKDSAVMLLLLNEMKKMAPFPFEIQAAMLDQKQPGFDATTYRQWLLQEHGLSMVLLEEDTYSIVTAKTEPGKSYCGLCSRLRRGILYNYAFDNGYTKIALGHHRDDLNETFLMNLFYGGKLATMAPRLVSDDQRNCVIRPMVYVPEDWIGAYARQIGVPVIPCNLCGNQEGLKRARMKALINELSLEYDQVGASMNRALANVAVDKLLDRRLMESVPVQVNQEGRPSCGAVDFDF